MTKSGATITYGPFNNIPITSAKEFLDAKQEHVAVHYAYDSPLIEVMKLKRSAEISHWGANLNIEDTLHLRNAGPAYVADSMIHVGLHRDRTMLITLRS